MQLQPGSPAPEFTLQSSNGPIRLADFRGRSLLLYFYPKDDTSGCTREALDFTALLPAFEAIGVTVVGVSKDSVARHEKFAGKHGLRHLLASDPEGVTIAAYGSWVEKTLYGRAYMGIDRSTFLIGADGRIVALWRKVRVPGHTEAVLKAAQGLATAS